MAGQQLTNHSNSSFTVASRSFNYLLLHYRYDCSSLSLSTTYFPANALSKPVRVNRYLTLPSLTFSTTSLHPSSEI